MTTDTRYYFRTEQIGNITLASDFWDCECEKDYIHHKSQQKCRKCGAIEEDMPDARANELQDMLKGDQFELAGYEHDALRQIKKMIEEVVCNNEGLKNINGAFVNAEIEEVDEGEVDILVKFGVQDGDENSCNTARYTVSREILRHYTMPVFEMMKTMVKA